MKNFESLMSRAKTLSRCSGDASPFDSDWWAGYMRGLRRAHHGEAFGTPGEHALWLKSGNDPQSVSRSSGYRAGLAEEVASPPEND